jgi:hypothetical protein
MSAPDVVACPQCGGKITNDPQMAGRQVCCPHCKRPFVLPAQTASSEAPPPLPLPIAKEAGTSFLHQAADFDDRFFKNLNIGGKTIFISSVAAAGSMLIKWVDVGFGSANGLSQGTFVFLALFIYPLLVLFKNQSIHLAGGVACGAVGIVLSMSYIASKESSFFGHSVSLASGGPYVFLFACVALIVGVVKYKPHA